MQVGKVGWKMNIQGIEYLGHRGVTSTNDFCRQSKLGQVESFSWDAQFLVGEDVHEAEDYKGDQNQLIAEFGEWIGPLTSSCHEIFSSTDQHSGFFIVPGKLTKPSARYVGLILIGILVFEKLKRNSGNPRPRFEYIGKNIGFGFFFFIRNFKLNGGLQQHFKAK